MSGPDDVVDTGFDAVIAGEKWEAPVEVEGGAAGHMQMLQSGATTPPPPQPTPVTAAVTAEPEEAVPSADEIVQATKALVQLPAIDVPTLAKLAREVAMDIKERGAILREFGLSYAQYEFLESSNEFYKAALNAACIEWHAPMSTPDRIRVEAAAILEESLVGLGARMQNKAEGLPGVIEAAKLFAKVAGVGEREAAGAAAGERFTINIDIGGGQTVTTEVKTIAPNAPHEGGLRTLPPD